MGKFLKWIKEHKKTAICIIAAIIIFPIIAIHILFKLHSHCYWLEAEWEAGEILGYFGDVLSFIGTVVLGYVAISQTETANKLSAELLKIEMSRQKPRLDICPNQQYKIFFGEAMANKLEAFNNENALMIDLLYTNNPRTGCSTGVALMEISIINNGFSDISRMFITNNVFYLHPGEPDKYQGKKITYFNGESNINAKENKKLYIYIRREWSSEDDFYDDWHKNHIDGILPYMDFNLELETTAGNTYIENIVCSSGWRNGMESTELSATRSITVTELDVQEKR